MDRLPSELPTVYPEVAHRSQRHEKGTSSPLQHFALWVFGFWKEMHRMQLGEKSMRSGWQMVPLLEIQVVMMSQVRSHCWKQMD